MKKTELMLKSLPVPSPPHITAMENMLQKVLREQAASEEEIENRHKAYSHLEAVIKAKIPGWDSN